MKTSLKIGVVFVGSDRLLCDKWNGPRLKSYGRRLPRMACRPGLTTPTEPSKIAPSTLTIHSVSVLYSLPIHHVNILDFFFAYIVLSLVAVFKYPPPWKLNASPMSVYLMPDLWSFTTCRACDFKKAKLVGNPTEGSGEGLVVQLNRRQAYYFASADGNGYDCIAGLTKFVATPMN